MSQEEKGIKKGYIYLPWLVLESSVLGLHSADTQAHNMEGNQTARLWQRMRGTRKNQAHILSFQILKSLSFMHLFYDAITAGLSFQTSFVVNLSANQKTINLILHQVL